MGLSLVEHANFHREVQEQFLCNNIARVMTFNKDTVLSMDYESVSTEDLLDALQDLKGQEYQDVRHEILARSKK